MRGERGAAGFVRGCWGAGMSAICRVALMLSRFALSAWVGAAALFVVTSVSEQVNSGFDVATKDTLALVRFPSYYQFGFALVGAGLLGTLVAGLGGVISRLRTGLAGLLISGALALMAVDYYTIYQPIVRELTPVGKTRTAEFDRLHQASKKINEIDVMLSFAGALLVCWPRRAAACADKSGE